MCAIRQYIISVYELGQLMLPCMRCRHWAVLVVAVHDLPRAVVAGGTCGPRSEAGSFPQLLSEASPSGRPEEAYPVVIMGTRARTASFHWHISWALCLLAGDAGTCIQHTWGLEMR